jgi:uncharacterized protein YjbJ (UPF0337 family)
MNKDIFEANWLKIKGKLKQQWGQLTENEITQMKGSFEEMVGKLQQKYGYEKEQAQKEIKDFLRKHGFSDKDEK